MSRQGRAAPTFRIGPQQVAHGPVVGHLELAIYGPNLIKGLYAGREAAVHAEDLAVYDGREAEVVKDLCAVAPDGAGPVLAKALVVEAVHLRDLA